MEAKWLKIHNKSNDYNVTLSLLTEDFIKCYQDCKPSPHGSLDNDYNSVTILGHGTFGTVKLCRNKKTNKYLAVKILLKEFIYKNKQVKQVCLEKKVLSAVCFPFLVHLEFSMRDNTCLYLGLPFVNGGEMYYYHRKVRKFNENQAKFYAAQVFLAIEYLHRTNTVYRDLKTENILIDNKGYIKLTDFGFCKHIPGGRTWTLCGTPEYLAPEIISAKAYGKSVDWWAFGVLVFEFVAGHSPFYKQSTDTMLMYERICNAKYKMPFYFSEGLKNFIESLLEIDVSKRIGVLKNGTKDIKEHYWFKEIKWNSILKKEIEPIYIPKSKDIKSLRNFGTFADIQIPKADSELYADEFVDF